MRKVESEMNEKYCAKCKIVYSSARQQCEECGETLSLATDEQKADFDKTLNDTMEESYTENKDGELRPWHFVYAAILVLYPVIITICTKKLVFLTISGLNIIYSLVLLSPLLGAKWYQRRFYEQSSFEAELCRWSIIIAVAIFNVFAVILLSTLI